MRPNTKEVLTDKTLGTKGELFVLDFMKSRGFEVFATNVKGLGYEIDLIVYKIHKDKVDIRLIEVKTRDIRSGEYEYVSLQTLGLKNKISKYIRFGPGAVSLLVEQLQRDCSEKLFFNLHIDLVIVIKVVDSDRLGVGVSEKPEKSFKLHKYYQNINLLI